MFRKQGKIRFFLLRFLANLIFKLKYVLNKLVTSEYNFD
jgi:hypothetical protein